MYEQNHSEKGSAKLSILLDAPVKRTNLVTKSEHSEPSTSSILLISLAIGIAMILVMYLGITYTEGSIKDYSTCRDKIIGFEQSGMYPNGEQFKLALSYCDAK